MSELLPDYASAPLRNFIDSWESNYRLLLLSMQGVSVLRGMPKLVEIMLAIPVATGAREKLTANLSEARKRAELAESEDDAGYPLLHAHALVAAWAALEAAVEDMLVGILVNEPAARKREQFARIRIHLAEFEALELDERMRLLLAEVGRNLGRKNGIAAFEGLLGCFDLSGSVTENDRKAIWQTHHLRNVIVHRASRADRRFVEACPWLNFKIGEVVVVTHGMLGESGMALVNYVTELAHRLGKRYGVDTVALVEKAKKLIE